MDPYMKGMAGFFLATIVLYFISKEKGGKWTTAFRIVAWMFGLGFWYYLTVTLTGSISIYTLGLLVVAVVGFIKRGKSGGWKVGFCVSLVYLIAPIISLIQAITDK